MSSFGLQTVNKESELDILNRTLGVVRPVIAEMMTRKAFYKDYGLLNDNELEDPLSLVRYNPKLDVIEGGIRRSYLRKYLARRVNEVIGISWNEFLELPYSEAEFILELCTDNPNRKDNTLEDLEKVLKSK